MAGNVRFNSNSASPDDLAYAANYPDGQRVNYPNAGLDRSGSFRESTENRMFSYGASTSRACASSSGDLPRLTQCLILDPISLGDQKYTWLCEASRVLGISLGSTSEENSFGAAHTKLLPPVAIEELKHFKASVLDATFKARGRAKRLNESLQKLNKHWEALNSKKQQRNNSFTGEKSGGLNILKTGMQSHRNPSDLGSQRLEDRTKSLVLQKRVRSSVAELRADGRSQTIARQPLVMGKDREILRDGGEGSDVVEEKIRRLPTGGDGWDKKMRRKRSVGSVSIRPTDGNVDSKRIMHHKPNGEPGLQSSDAQGFRSGSFNSAAVVGKIDDTFLPASSSMRMTPKNDGERVLSSKDFTGGLNKERLVAKENKSSVLEDNHMVNPGQVTKGKASRAPRTGSVIAACSSPNFPRVSGSLDGWELPSSINKVNPVSGANNRKRPIPTGSASPPMAQWVGQRPQKISRTRRANLVSPVTTEDELQLPSQGCPPCDNGSRVHTVGTNGSFLARAAVINTQQIRVKHENISSPARLSESEESGAGEKPENMVKERGTVSGEAEEKALDQNAGMSLLLPKKNKILVKEEIGDGVRRQGRSSRGSSFTRASISPVREKLEGPKPLKNTRMGSDKNESSSKSGRPPLKKLSDRKAFTRLGHAPNGTSPDFTESDDDREELLAAANFACNASYLACSGSFWKKMEPVFARFSSEDTSSLKQQLESMEELHKGISAMFDHTNDTLGDLVKAEDFLLHLASEETERSVQDQILLERGRKFPPLFQRVLSALIVEDEFENYEEKNEGRNIYFQFGGEDALGGTCLPMDVEPRKGNDIDLEYEPMLDVKSQMHCSVGRYSCNGSSLNVRSTSMHNQLCSDGLFQEVNGFMDSKIGILPEFSEVCGKEQPSLHASSVISAHDCPYEQMCLEDKLLLELQSIGLFPETVPDLADGENEAINQDIIELQKELHKQVGKKNTNLNGVWRSIEEGMKAEIRDLEQVAMDRLIEMSYKKLLAARGSFASKYGVPKVSRQVALVFMKRTLARYHRFEDMHKSCFSEPALRDIIFAAPPRANDAESTSCFGLAVSANKKPEDSQVQVNSGSSDASGTPVYSCDQDFAKTGPILNRGKKKELFLDDVGGSASFRAPPLGNTLLGGAKGKRGERERDKDRLCKNSVTKASRTSMNNVKAERKTKSKPKQKTAQLSTAGNGVIGKFTEATHPAYSLAGVSNEKLSNDSNKKREVRMMSYGNNAQDSSKDVRGHIDITNTNELDTIEELGVADEFGGHQDLSNWFNFEEDGLQDHDSMGLDIPMDDLSELNMLL